MGVQFGNVWTYENAWVQAARGIGLTDTAVVLSVVPSSAADRAGLQVGDRVLRIGDTPITPGRKAIASVAAAYLDLDRSGPHTTVAFVRRDQFAEVTVGSDSVCAYDVLAVRDESLNAWADGSRVFVTSALLRFATDDEELGTIVAHEIAHNALGHIDAKVSNSLLGALFGAVADIALAAGGGINTQGAFTKAGAEAGSMVFSQEFELEADYVGLYILALSDQGIDSRADIWRRFAAESPKSIRFAYSHPTTAERFVHMEQWISEINTKRIAGVPLQPELRRGVSLARARRKDDGRAYPVVAATPVESRVTRDPSPSPDLSQRPLGTPLAARPDPARSAVPHDSAPPTTQNQAAKVPEREARGEGGTAAIAIVGAPRNEQDRAAAAVGYRDAQMFMHRHEWLKAEKQLRLTVRLDGSVAAYHAALGSVLIVLQRGAEAEAAYSAAVLLDPDNDEYRRRLKQARGMP
jgi:predicted Zn-dependent protease